MDSINIKTIWDDYYPKVYGYFLRRINLREDVEDLTSVCMEKYLSVLTDPEKKSKVKHLHGYLWKVCHNQLVNYIRFKDKKPMNVSIEDHTWVVDSKIEDRRSNYVKDRMEKLILCIKNYLSEKEVRIIQLCILEDRKSKEVATLLKSTSDAIRQALSRSLKKVRNKCGALWTA